MTNPKENQERAQAQFHKALKRTHDAKQAVSRYEADARAVIEKTAKLRALRLAKEAADAKDAPEKRVRRKTKPSPGAGKTSVHAERGAATRRRS
jgi:hypothetical protein